MNSDCRDTPVLAKMLSRWVRALVDETLLTDCPVCEAIGRVASRLPFRKKVCDECGGTGEVSALRREQLLKRMKVAGTALTGRFSGCALSFCRERWLAMPSPILHQRAPLFQ